MTRDSMNLDMPMPQPPRVLFVCVENSCRSQIAQAFMNIHGGGKVEAYSAGSRPCGVVNPRAIASMRERGYDLATHTSKSLDDIPEVKFDAAITMGCGDACPMVRARIHEDWGIPDPKSMGEGEFRQVRDQIEAKVKSLLERLAVPR
jgi:arsenate reductase (thioredoxin)